MKPETTDYRAAVDALPAGGVLKVFDVPWDDYERLLRDLNDRPGVRVNYDRGKMEIVSPLSEHEDFNRLIERIMVVLSDVLRTDIESRGSTTWKKRSAGRGTEPDSCFYVANAARILGKRRLDIARDPPPDLVVEIDVTSRSLGKFPTYAAFRVPEIWRYLARKGRLEFYGLSDRKYVVISSSLSFPILTPRALEAFIEQSKTEGQTAAAAAFRRWLRGRMRSKRK